MSETLRVSNVKAAPTRHHRMTLINVDDVELTPQGIHMICGYRASRRVARLMDSILSYRASGKATLLHCEWDDEQVRLGKDRVGDDGTFFLAAE